MLQRIQTVYLLIVFILSLVIIFYPIAEILGQDGHLWILSSTGLRYKGGDNFVKIMTYPLLINLFLISFLSFITILLFKKRKLQIRLGRINIFLILLSLGIIYYYSQIITDAKVHYRLIAVIPFILIILTFMANRRIRKDEELIRSADRIR